MNQSIEIEFVHDHQDYKSIFEGNKEFIQEKLQLDENYFENLAKGQSPKYLIIGCSDSRVPPNDLTKLHPGDIFNHRNIGNQVLSADMNVHSVIQYAVDELKVKHIIVMGHTHCGGSESNNILAVQAAIDGKSFGGIIDLWLSHLKDTYDKYFEELDQLNDMEEKVTRLGELNVVEQVMNIWKNPYVQRSWKRGHPVWVHGWIFRMETGHLEEILVETQFPKILQVYEYKFDSPVNKLKRQKSLLESFSSLSNRSRNNSMMTDEFKVFACKHDDTTDMSAENSTRKGSIDFTENP